MVARGRNVGPSGTKRWLRTLTLRRAAERASKVCRLQYGLPPLGGGPFNRLTAGTCCCLPPLRPLRPGCGGGLCEVGITAEQLRER